MSSRSTSNARNDEIKNWALVFQKKKSLLNEKTNLVFEKVVCGDFNNDHIHSQPRTAFREAVVSEEQRSWSLFLKQLQGKLGDANQYSTSSQTNVSSSEPRLPLTPGWDSFFSPLYLLETLKPHSSESYKMPSCHLMALPSTLSLCKTWETHAVGGGWLRVVTLLGVTSSL